MLSGKTSSVDGLGSLSEEEFSGEDELMSRHIEGSKSISDLSLSLSVS